MNNTTNFLPLPVVPNKQDTFQHAAYSPTPVGTQPQHQLVPNTQHICQQQTSNL